MARVPWAISNFYKTTYLTKNGIVLWMPLECMYGSPNVTKIWNTNYFLGEGLLIILTSFFLLDFDKKKISKELPFVVYRNSTVNPTRGLESSSPVSPTSMSSIWNSTWTTRVWNAWDYSMKSLLILMNSWVMAGNFMFSFENWIQKWIWTTY